MVADVPSFPRRFARIIAQGCRTVWKPLAAAFIVQFGLAVVYAWAYNYISSNSGNIVQAIVDMDQDGFTTWTWKLLGVAALGAIANGLILSLGTYMCRTQLRSGISAHLLERYIANTTYYRIGDYRVGCDGSEMDAHIRIPGDTDAFVMRVKCIIFGTPQYVGYLCTTVTTVYFMYTLWDLAGWFVPVATLILFFVTAIGCGLLAKPPASSSKRVSEYDAAFLDGHARFAMYAEHVAFLDGGKDELDRLDVMLGDVFGFVRRVAMLHIPLNMWSMFFYWGNATFSLVIPGIAWLWFGNDEFTDYTIMINVSSACYAALTTLSTYVLLSEETASLRATTARLAELMEAFDADTARPLPPGKPTQRRAITASAASTGEKSESLPVLLLKVDGVTVVRPDHHLLKTTAHAVSPVNDDVIQDVIVDAPVDRVLVRDVTFDVKSGRSIVIMGPSGCGKTSLLRVIAGLWPAVGGSISIIDDGGRRKTKNVPAGVCEREGVIFLPQRPYLTEGSLASQLTYPDPPSPAAQNEYLRLLDIAELDYLANRLNDHADWASILSVGEQQRLGVARVLYHQPRLAVMDEATSAVDEETEARLLQAVKAAGVTLLSVAHRSTVMRFHESVLRVQRGGAWRLENL